MARYPGVDALVLECTNLPPYRPTLEKVLGLPVFDVLDLLKGFHAEVSKTNYLCRLDSFGY